MSIDTYWRVSIRWSTENRARYLVIWLGGSAEKGIATTVGPRFGRWRWQKTQKRSIRWRRRSGKTASARQYYSSWLTCGPSHCQTEVANRLTNGSAKWTREGRAIGCHCPWDARTRRDKVGGRATLSPSPRRTKHQSSIWRGVKAERHLSGQRSTYRHRGEGWGGS